MERDPQEVEGERDGLPRPEDLERYQIPLDRVNYDRERRQEEYDRYRREQERVREEEEHNLRQDQVRKDWERLQREQQAFTEYDRSRGVLERIPEEPMHTPHITERLDDVEQREHERELQQQNDLVELASAAQEHSLQQHLVLENQLVPGEQIVYQQEHKIDVPGHGIIVMNIGIDNHVPQNTILRSGIEGIEEQEQKYNTDNHIQVVNLKKPIFFSELHEFYASAEHTDTIIRCKDGDRRAHSIVLGAASSLFRFMFAEISEKILDSEYIISFPDITVQECEELLKPVYGFSQEPGQETVKTDAFGFNLDFNEGGMYEARMRKEREEREEREREERGWMIPENQIKQERRGKRGRYDSLIEDDSDEDFKPRNKTKHGYAYDSFVEESSSDSEGRVDYDSDDDIDDDLFDERPKGKRGRKKGSKNTRKYTKRIKENGGEPMLCVKEEAIDKTFDEFNEMFLQKTQVTRNAEIKFAQDHIGFYHCQEEGCAFKTMVRPSIHQHHKFTHQNLHGYQEALLGCNNCGESWVNQIHYRKHIDSNECRAPNNVVPYVCENCGAGWYNLTNYTKHAAARECKTNTSHEGKRPCSNSSCPLTFFSDKNRETHENRAHKPITAGTMYRCAKCNINFINHKDYNKHKKDVHNEKPRGGFVVYVCKVTGCEYTNPERKIFENHVRIEHPDECWICELCGRNFSDPIKLEQHHQNNPGGRGGKRCLPVNYNCPHCPREFNRKRHMELHVLFKHTQERPFGCDQCGKRFKTRHCVNVHLRSHGIGGYSWCCEECGKTFNQISAYHTHLKVHSNVRDFACEDCGMTFKLKHSLKKHQLVHKPEFGHTCDFCGKKFKRSDNLINHRRRHTGEHPYKCDKCNWTGPDSSSFIHHKKKHADVVHNSQELKLMHAIAKLPGHLLDRDGMNGRDNHSDIM
ncbi:zinc finger protein 665 isoform X3 [Eurytemora carolleeae]|uniref:zinc finger protein 665 isoform X3 n=1 Tax=Eurytemora carolleeae TaxID=1294199 RepID=UPI000C7876D0|nr:zinc finger protein 665 isoform X3 [Eurytemora carolleeae]|eukprot:XP_023324495.1 zinc finger protein 665-like isoform X3 [Eurytemora affinis]